MFGSIRRVRCSPLLFIPLVWGMTAGCGDDGPSGTYATSRVVGRVEGPGGYGSPGAMGPQAVAGATVILVRAAADGSTDVISREAVTTDAEGRFTLETDVEGRGDYLVTATAGGSTWRALIAADLEHGSEVAAPPINSETTAEADVYLVLAAEGGAGMAARADVATRVNAGLGVEAVEQTSVRAALADGFAFGSDVMTGAMVRSGVMSEQTSAAAEARVAALADAEAALLVAQTAQDVDAAVAAHLESDLEAVHDAGVAARTQAWIRAASGLAVIQATALAQQDARLELERRAVEIRARAAAHAVTEIFTELDAPPAILVSLTGARVSVLASIHEASTAGSLQAALRAYHEAVLHELELALGARGAAVVSAHDAVNEVGGPVFDLELALPAAVTAEAWVDAFASFRTAVRAVVAVNLAGAPATEVDAVAACLTVVNVPM